MKKNYLKIINKEYYIVILKKMFILFLIKYKIFFINKKNYINLFYTKISYYLLSKK